MMEVVVASRKNRWCCGRGPSADPSWHLNISHPENLLSLSQKSPPPPPPRFLLGDRAAAAAVSNSIPVLLRPVGISQRVRVHYLFSNSERPDDGHEQRSSLCGLIHLDRAGLALQQRIFVSRLLEFRRRSKQLRKISVH